MGIDKALRLKITLFLFAILLIILIGYPFFNQKYGFEQQNSEVKVNFIKFLEEHNKSYDRNDIEFSERFENFKMTMSFIKDANVRKIYGEDVEFGLTKFSDLSDEEFQKKFLKDEKNSSTKYRSHTFSNNVTNEIPKDIPTKIDWRERGIVSEIRNQGHCGSCYAQSVIGTIESAITLNYNLSKPFELSVQQMVDCAENFNQGCLGGDTCDLLQWLKRSKIKILPKEYYPDTKNHIAQKCKNVTLPEYVKTAKVLKYTCLDFTGYEYEILNILSHKGPLAASVNGLLWKNYLGGVIKYHCNGPSNHAVEIVGYDLSPPDPHYIVRNSWGVQFGNNGYAKIAFGNNVCNIASEVSMVEVEWS